MTDITIGGVEIRRWNYMGNKYNSKNYGSHTQALMVGDLTLFYSYDTVIAFQWNGKEYYSENDYGSNTTGKHLVYLGGAKGNRIKKDIFDKLLSEALRDFKWQMVLGK